MASRIPERAAETRQFDFWIGEWDLTWDGGGGTNVIRAILDDHVIEEQFRSNDGSLEGMSVSVWSPQLGQWQQTWVDSQGSYIALSGGWDGQQMVLLAQRPAAAGPVQLRMVFYNIARDQLDWRWERSTDRGQGWSLQWQIHYQRKAKMAS